MYLIALATDYDGTLAHNGRVEETTIRALERLKDSGRRLVLVTGRELPDFQRVFDRLDLFDVVVVENGSLLFLPATREEKLVAEAPPQRLIEALRTRKVAPLSVGRGIVATWSPHEAVALDVIRELGLEWQIIFNKGAVMMLPPGINKATGLAAALSILKLSPLNIVAIGDAENDHAFLSASGCSVAVANALPAVKETADLVTTADHGAGVEEAIAALMEDGSVLTASAARRRSIRIGPEDAAAVLSVDAGGVLIAGSSGIGKSTLAMSLIEKLSGQGFQICVLDPEGDYDEIEPGLILGDATRPPIVTEVLDVLDRPDSPPLVVNMLGLKLEDRPAFFRDVVGRIGELRAETARPHWLLVDEAHHMLPTGDMQPPPMAHIPSVIYVTVHPDQMSPGVLRGVQTVLAVGSRAPDVLASFCAAIGEAPPSVAPGDSDDKVLFWNRPSGEPPRWVRADRPQAEHKRHTRKYARGELGDDKSFYFTGPDGKLNLRAQNLMIFLQIAEGIDDETWLYHLRRGDYARWFREAIKDDDLADEAQPLQDAGDAAQSRSRMREIVERRYTAPAGS